MCLQILQICWEFDMHVWLHFRKWTQERCTDWSFLCQVLFPLTTLIYQLITMSYGRSRSRGAKCWSHHHKIMCSKHSSWNRQLYTQHWPSIRCMHGTAQCLKECKHEAGIICFHLRQTWFWLMWGQSLFALEWLREFTSLYNFDKCKCYLRVGTSLWPPGIYFRMNMSSEVLGKEISAQLSLKGWFNIVVSHGQLKELHGSLCMVIYFFIYFSVIYYSMFRINWEH